MRIHKLTILIFFINFNLRASQFMPLNFEEVLPINCVANLLQLTTQLFYDIDYSTIQDLQGQDVLTKITARLIDLIGAIYLFNYQNQHQSNICYIKPADLVYFADLIHDTNFAFKKLVYDLKSEQIQFINNLFLQINLLIGKLTKPNLHLACH